MPNVDTPKSVMWTVAQIAKRDNVSRQSVSKKVIELVAKHDLTVERDERQRIVAVNVAQYDHLRGRYKSQAHAQVATAERQTIADAESYDEALRQKTWHEAERKKFELAQLRGELVPVSLVNAAIARMVEEISRVVDRLPAQADNVAVALAREGTSGVREALKKIGLKIRTEIADALEAVADGAPEPSPETEEDP